MPRTSAIIVAILVGLALSSAAWPADEPATDPAVPVQVFKAPTLKHLYKPSYPSSQERVGNEGWVNVNFMISPKGEPYEITVTDSSGIEAFEKTAVDAVKRWRFEPAMLGDTPVDAGQNYKLLFHLYNPADGASSKFVAAYRTVLKNVASGDQVAARAGIDSLEVTNLYEDAFYNLINAQYLGKWGTEAEERRALRRTIAREKKPRYLKKSTFAAALERLLMLEVKSQDLAGALKTWEKLEPIASKEAREQWARPIAEIRALKTSDRPFGLNGHISRGTSWYGELFRNRFSIKVQSGKVEEIKLRCEKGYIFFKYEPGLLYTVDSKNSSCDIEVVGDHDTRFELIQS